MALLPLLQQSWLELHKTPFHVLLFLVLLLSFVYIFKHFISGKPKFPPSPPKLPIIGKLHQLGKLPHRSLHGLSKKYGPIMFLDLGYAPTVVVSSADMAKEIIKTNDIIFSNWPETMAVNFLYYGSIDVAFSQYGEYWRQAKKICVLKLLSLKRVQSFQYVREEVVEESIKKIRDSCLKGASINLSEIIIATLKNIVTRCVFGQKFEDNGKSKIGELPRRVMVLLAAFSLGDFFPYLRWIDVLTGFIPSLKSTFGEIDAFLDQVVQQHMIIKVDDGLPNKNDFVDSLLKLRNSGKLDFELTHKNLKALLLDMFVGGIDSTSIALEWVMAELIRSPSIMMRTQEEIRRVVGTKSHIEVEDMNQMNYLKCTLEENMRLYPPLPLLPRETSTCVKFRGYDIPPKIRVLINVFTIQRDPKIWDRLEEFVPDRFQDNQIDFKGLDFELIPFGSGRRGCPEMSFSVVIAEYVIANLLCWFDWKLPSANAQGKDLDMTEVNALTVFKKIPLELVAIPYSP
ncbi:phenylacetaldehyde oxime monooxygenase CYP71AN24-like [Quercus robur]|uniref:phenylacetaldehyde oxime monooxygenase CYP71AN24-like n=1 Tax=Quercus robur TaxID=38942 RepID=UPI002162904F|nr:phenylacetaldehyde oxime monooxygenase CYP71AN24-like [Quercus robur]